MGMTIAELMAKNKEVAALLTEEGEGKKEEDKNKEEVAAGEIPQEVLLNLSKLREGIEKQIPGLHLIVEIIHKQLIQIPELVHLLNDEQIGDIVEIAASAAQIQITPAIKEKTTKAKVNALVKAGKEMAGRISIDDI